MIKSPIWLQALFVTLTFIAIYGLYASSQSLRLLRISLLIMVFTGVVSMSGLLNDPFAIPPRIPFLIIPAAILGCWLFLSKRGKQILDGMNLKTITLLHTIRIPVEFGILGLYTIGLMPESMTFEGRNFDILSGVSAPFIAYFGYVKKTLPNGVIVAWNVICLLLVLHVLITGALSAPSVIQLIDFDQPNSAVLFFPYAWLPAIIVPIVVIGHLAVLRAIYKSTNQYK